MHQLLLARPGPQALTRVLARSLPPALAGLLVVAALGAGEASAWQRQDFEARVDSYPPAKRSVLRSHLDRALSRLEHRDRQFEVAAAINSYVHQYLRNISSAGDAVSILNRGHSICGGAATTMNELLHLAGIRSRHAALLGISNWADHALVQVYFRDGRTGLFDPTAGIFWYSPRSGRPVPLARLVANPALSDRTLHKSHGRKRVTLSDPVVPTTSVAAGYSRRRYVIRSSTGRLIMDYRKAFAESGGAGVANSGRPLPVRIRLRPGARHGNPRWDGVATPERRLILTKYPSGAYLPWPHVLGWTAPGYDVVHSYRLRGLRPGRRYRLRLGLLSAKGARLRATIATRSGQPARREIGNLAAVPAGRRAPEFRIGFSARRPRERITVQATGSVMLQAIVFERSP